MKVSEFRGINNVVDSTRLKTGEMIAATDVDIGETANLLSRRGRVQLQSGAAHSPYEAPFGTLVVIDNNLMLLDAAGATVRMVYDTLGYTRVWYATLPDGRVAFSNGLIQGLTTATETTEWGTPAPADPGEGISGATPYQITYVRTSDGREGPPVYGPPIDTTQAIIGLPQRDGFSINVYFAPYGGAMFLAGSTATDTFQHGGAALGPQFVGTGLAPPPVGTQMAVWGARVLLAEGRTLWATRPLQPELCDLTRDFIQFEGDITLVYGTGEGIFVGTTRALYFLKGEVFSELRMEGIVVAPVVLGSLVEFPLSYLAEDARPKDGADGALCIVDGYVYLLHGGGASALTAQKYRTTATEVFSTVRLRDGVMQYLAAPA